MAKLPTATQLKPFKSDGECYEWAQAVQRKWSSLTYESGFFVQDNQEPADHAWCVTPDGTIIDTTSSQFGIQTSIIRADNPLHSRYVSYERQSDRAQVLAQQWEEIGNRNSLAAL